MAFEDEDEDRLSQYQVFINFRGEDIRNTFLGHLFKELESNKVKVFTDEVELRGTPLKELFKQIEDSRVALAIFSEKYTESHWCLDELVKMKDQMEEGKLVVIPIFFKVDPTDCKTLHGAFGDNFKILAYKYEKTKVDTWVETMKSVTNNSGLHLDLRGNERNFAELIVENVIQVLMNICIKEGGNFTIGGGNERLTNRNLRGEAKSPYFGVEQRLKQVEEKLKVDHDETRFIGVVGMPGIGKTTLAKMLYEKWARNFKSRMLFLDVNKVTKRNGFDSVQNKLIQQLLKDIHPEIEYTEFAHEFWKDDLLKRKVFVVLDDIGNRKQLEFLLGTREWIKKGSKIVITSCDESLLQVELVDDTYVIPRLNSSDSLLCFTNHAFGLDYAKGNFVELCRHFLDYAKGNPLALKALGEELRGKDEAYWEDKVGKLTQSSNEMIHSVLKRKYDELTIKQKDTFQDIACFFKSKNADYVRCLMDSSDGIRDLTNKFFLNISGGRVEMHNMLCTFAKELASLALAQDIRVQYRLSNYQDISCVLQKRMGMQKVRGLFLDLAKVPEQTRFDAHILRSTCSLLYLKIHNTAFLKDGNADFKIDNVKELQLPLHKLRYLHWLKFPLNELPSEFTAMNLVTLELRYSSIKQLWDGVKETPKLKVVDLSYSHKLNNLSGLSNAPNLERLTLEGCRRLVKLPQEMKNMKSLISLNMRGCERLKSIPVMKLSSLEVLILSNCSSLEKFEVISKNLKAVYLDGAIALKGLPQAIGDLERLAILNLRGCKLLESLPDSLGKQKALEELILSGCLKLENVPKSIRNMIYLRILLLDGTRIKEMPKLYSLQRLCLSGNTTMISLQRNISQLSHLKWIHLKNCKNLIYLTTLPPNLEFFDATGCERLETIADPLALQVMTEQIRCAFFFTNCINLKQDARDVISSYAQWKCQRLAVECYDRGVFSGALFKLCYPGFEIPLWFPHKAVGSFLELRLQVKPHWFNNRLSGIALCAVVSFPSDHTLLETFSVKCKIKFENKDGTSISLDYDVGSFPEPGKIESDHVFIGYSSWSDLTKRLEGKFSGNSVPTKAFLEFYTTDACISEVVSCGISLVYAEPQDVPVEASDSINSSKKSGGLVEDFFVYIIAAFLFVVIFAPQYYLRILNFLGPLLVFILFFLVLALIVEWKVRKLNEQKVSEASESVGQ